VRTGGLAGSRQAWIRARELSYPYRNEEKFSRLSYCVWFRHHQIEFTTTLREEAGGGLDSRLWLLVTWRGVA
jgi:hypothetical protein